MIPVTDRNLAKYAKTLSELFFLRCEVSKNQTAIKYKEEAEWINISWGEFAEKVRDLGAVIVNDIKKEDKVSILGDTKFEWALCDLAVISAGGVSVGIYPTLSPPQMEYIINHSDSVLIFVDTEEHLQKIISLKKSIPRVKRVVVWDKNVKLPTEDRWCIKLSDYINQEKDKTKLDYRIRDTSPNDTAIIIYTSGTTGPPKGAMITHNNLINFLRAWEGIIDITDDDVSLHFLPMAHGAERVAGFYGRISVGLCGAYATSIKSVIEEVKEIKPTVFGSVPRIFEKVYSQIRSEVARKPLFVQKIFRWAEKNGREYIKLWNERKTINLSKKIKKYIASFILRRIKKAFGGRVRFFITGAAPISQEILEFMWACGLPIYEVYGLTEATVVTHANKEKNSEVKLGTVGRPIPGVECKIADDGEILVRGETIFKGYYKDDEATREAKDDEGWLHTGDIGEIDWEGYLRITDRKKHIIITAGGKNIAPANIENLIKSKDPIISQVHVHGDKRPYLTALITLNPAELLNFAITNNLIDEDLEKAKAKNIIEILSEKPLSRPPGVDEITEKLSKLTQIRQRVKSAVDAANEELSKVENIRRFKILPRDFYIEEGEVTPTLKTKRKEIEEKYKNVLDEIYKYNNHYNETGH